MSIEEMRKCDRCERSEPVSKPGDGWVHFVMEHHGKAEGVDDPGDQLDLCVRCFPRFKQFLAEGDTTVK